MTTSDAYREVGEAAWAWVLAHVRDDDGPWLPESVRGDWQAAGPPDDRDSLYSGIAGLAPVLAEISESRPMTPVEHDLARRISDRLATQTTVRREASLYDGVAGDG